MLNFNELPVMNIFTRIFNSFKRLSPYYKGLFISAIFVPALVTIIGIFAFIFCDDIFLLIVGFPVLVMAIMLFYFAVIDND